MAPLALAYPAGAAPPRSQSLRREPEPLVLLHSTRSTPYRSHRYGTFASLRYAEPGAPFEEGKSLAKEQCADERSRRIPREGERRGLATAVRVGRRERLTRANDAVAASLAELADLLAISEGDPYRVRAYEKAARSVAEYPVEVDQLDEKELDAIPAVGGHIAAKIVQLLATGHLEELDDLRAQLPAGLRSLLGVPGLGPKRAHQVYEELHVTSLAELMAALQQHQLRGLHGWGEKSETHIAEALHGYVAASGRLQLPTALDLAGELLGPLRAVPGVTAATFAGSIRRMCESVGDIDILVASTDTTTLMEALASLPSVGEVVAQGGTKAVARTTTGVQLDVRVVAPGVFGAALLYFTGSKAHGIHLRRIAQGRGLKLSEYGLERVQDGAVLAASTEEEIYSALGMSFIPPTLREDHGEIEAAEKGELPVLVRRQDLRGDLHTHTDLTDGLATLDEMVAAARALRYRYLAVTDHAPLLYMQRMTTEKALAQREAVRRLSGRGGLTLLHGSELNIQPDGSLDWDDDFLSTFDVLVASVHSAFQMSRDDMTKRLIKAIEHPAVNVVAHPTGRSLGHRAPVDFDAEAVFEAAARAGTALEINSSPDRLDLNGELARLARRHGALLAVSSDAHATRHLANVAYGIATAQRGWLEAADVINTWPLDRLRSFLAKRRRP